MEAQEIKVQKILESDLLIDRDYPSESILQKCYVWYAITFFRDFEVSLVRKVKQREWSGTKGSDWTL